MIKISKQQAQFLRSKAHIVTFRGGIRSGKTVVLCCKAIEYALQKRRYAIISFSYPMLRDVCMYTMRWILTRPDINYPFEENKSEKAIIIDGQEILFRSGDEPDSLRGLSLDGFGIDETRNFKTREILDIMLGRLSNSEDAQAHLVSSPKGKNWNWELEKNADVETIVQRTEDNPFLPAGYIARLRANYTSKFAKQELDADIVEFGAGVIDPAWFRIVPQRKCEDGIRFWDLAVSVKTNADRSAGALVSNDNGAITIHDMRAGRFQYPDLRQLIIETAKRDGRGVTICIEEAGQQRGFIDDLKYLPELMPYRIEALKPEGDKFNRAMPWASRAQLGSVVLCEGEWNRAFLDECASFTADDSHEHDDQIDAVSGAYFASLKFSSVPTFGAVGQAG